MVHKTLMRKHISFILLESQKDMDKMRNFFIQQKPYYICSLNPDPKYIFLFFKTVAVKKIWTVALS